MVDTRGALAETCVVIPTYNEAANIEALLCALRRLSPELKIIVVDDASPDGTGDLAEGLAARLGPLQVIRRAGKAGRGSACLEGFTRALADPKARFVAEMDADFSHDPAELPRLVECLQGADVAVGSRYACGSRIVAWGLGRRLFSRLANAFARTLLGLPLSDCTNGYRAYTREALSGLDFSAVESSGYIALSEIASLLQAQGRRFVELPTVFVNRRRGRSNLGLGEVLAALGGVLSLARRRAGTKA